MKIAVLKEPAGETRCAAIPETVKKFIALGADVAIEAGAGEAASIPDSDFEAAGAKLGSRADALKGAGVILAVNGPDPATLQGAEQGAEQSFQDHRIGDVVDLKLVEAQQRCLFRKIGGDLADRLACLLPALALDAVMHVEHEGVEMHPACPRHRSRGEKQIHQHRFAAPDRPPEIKPLRRRFLLPKPGQAREPAEPSALRLILA